jgi:hypothetical protein
VETSSTNIVIKSILKAGMTKEFTSYSYQSLFHMPCLLVQSLDLIHDEYEELITLYLTFDEFIAKMEI